MAKATKGDLRLSTKSLQEIWKKIPVADWYAVLQEYRPEHQWSMKGEEIYGLCIFHNDSTPSMHVSPTKGFVHCFGCSTNMRNPLRFYQSVTKLGYTGAIADLKKRFNLKAITEKYARAAQEIEDSANVKAAIMLACNDELAKIIQDPDHGIHGSPVLYDPVREFIRFRKYPTDAIHRWPVGVLPSRARLIELLSTMGKGNLVNSALNYLGTYADDRSGRSGSLVFFNYTSPDMMGRIKIRPIGGEYKTFYYVDDPHCDEVGLFGGNMFSRLSGHLDNYYLYVVEGETDALSVMAHSMSEGKDDICIVATGGSMEQDLDDIVKLGFKGICLIPDNDTAGVGWAKNIMKKKKTVKRVFAWPEHYLGIKDIDEALRAKPISEVFSLLEDDGAITSLPEWAFTKFMDEVGFLPDSEISRKAEIAATFTESLTDLSEKDLFGEKIEKECNINRSSAVIFDRENTNLEDLGGVLANRIKTALPLLGYDSSDADRRRIVLWNTKQKQTLELDTKSSGSYMRTVLEGALGGLEAFITKEIGEVPRLQYTMTTRGPAPMSTAQKITELNELVRNTAARLLGSATPLASKKRISRGVHWVEDGDTNHCLVINGNVMLKGTVGETSTIYEELDHPVVKDMYIVPAHTTWSKYITSKDSIQDGFSYDPIDLFGRLKEIFSSNWRFENHDLDTSFIAADILYTPIASVFSQMVPVDISGDPHSGKTTFMQFIAGHASHCAHLCESSLMIDDFSVAGVRQHMTGCPFRLFLDEFENTDGQGSQKHNRRAEAVTSLLGDLRSIATGISSTRGTAHGASTNFNLHFPITVAGVYTMADYRDMTRYIHLKTKKVSGHQDLLKNSVLNNYKAFDDVRRGITLCFLPRIHEVRRAYIDVRNEFANNAYGIPSSMARLLDSLLPAAAIMKLAKVDYVDFVTRYCQAQAEYLGKALGKEDYNIWTHVLGTPIPISIVGAMEQSGKLKSLESMLSDHTYRQFVNNSDIGVIFLEDKRWLVVHWPKVLHTILKQTTAYRGATDFCRLKDMADKDPRVLNGSTAESIITDLNQQKTHGTLSKRTVTILDMSKDMEMCTNTPLEEPLPEAHLLSSVDF